MIHLGRLLAGVIAVGVMILGLSWLVTHPIVLLILFLTFMVIAGGAVTYFLGEAIIKFATLKRE